MAYWLMKSEPDVFGIDDLRRKKVEGWNGVRNYMARNFMRAMKKGDFAFFYHSNASPSGVAGVMEIAREAYPDPTQFDGRSEYFEPRSTRDRPLWDQVDVRYLETLPRIVPLGELRAEPRLRGMRLFTHSRLSVMPVSPEHWRVVLGLAK